MKKKVTTNSLANEKEGKENCRITDNVSSTAL